MANIAALVLETVPSVGEQYGAWFTGLERVSVTIFAAEYIARIWSCTVADDYAGAIRGRARFAAKPLLVVDLLAILPTLLSFGGVDLRVLRAARMFRLLRMAKLVRYSAALRAVGRVIDAKKEQLVIVGSVLGLLVFVASSLMYFAERSVQPEDFSSIPAAMWWAVATLSTVGYGDAVPFTPLGKLCAAAVALLGIGMFALPAGILGSGFVSELERDESIADSCPRCGQPVSTGAK